MGYNRGNYKPPKAQQIWKEGHKCVLCGQEMLKSQFSKDEFEKSQELRWGFHYVCQQKMSNVLDRNAK